MPSVINRQLMIVRRSCIHVIVFVQLRRALGAEMPLSTHSNQPTGMILGDTETGTLATDVYLIAVKVDLTNRPSGRAARRVTMPDT